MKKCLAFISSLLLLSTAAFADISAKKLGDGNVEVTFFYGNPRATEVLVAGDFTNWQDGAESMTKGDNGFTLTKVFPAGTTLKYKFISDGNWTEDIHAPDKIDDGFGGHNALADLDELAGGSSDAAGSGTKKPSVKFQTWSMVGFQSLWNLGYDDSDKKYTDGKKHTDDDGLAATGLGAKSYWKFSGNVTPHVPVYVEVALFENTTFDNFYKSGSLRAKDGLKNAGTDLVFDPIYWLGGQTSVDTATAGVKANQYSYLGHFKSGIEFPWVKYVAGVKYAKLSPHSNVNWTTVDNEWEAGYSGTGGFSELSAGTKVAETLADLTGGAVSDFEAVIAPNRTADRAGTQYGLYSYMDAVLLNNHYVDFQYNGAFGKDGYDTALDTIYESDYILGYRGKYGPVTVKANGLINYYGSDKVGDKYKSLYAPSSSDVGVVDDDIDDKINDTAANINVNYVDDIFDAKVGFRYRGAQASMMYVEQGADDHDHIEDNLGKLNRYRVWFDVSAAPTEFFTIGLNPYMEKTFSKKEKLSDNTEMKYSFNDKDNTLFYIKPYGDFYLGEFVDLDATISFYAEAKHVTKDADKFTNGGLKESKDSILEEAGLKFETKFEDGPVSSLSVMYGYDANDDDCVLHTVIAEAGLPLGINAQAGAGMRTIDGEVVDYNPFGFFLGLNKQINKTYNTILYTQFVYNMDPYKEFGDGQDTLNLDEYTLDSDANYFWNQAAFRIALKFDF